VPTSLRLALRSVPLVLAILVVIFTTGDAWRLFGGESGVRFGVLIAIIVGLGVAATVRVVAPKDQDKERWTETIWLYRGYELSPNEEGKKERKKRQLISSLVDAGFDVQSDLREGSAWIRQLTTNVYVLFWFIVISQLIAVALWIAFIFALLGFIAVNGEATKMLLDNGTPTIIWQFSQFGQTFIFTRQLLLLSITLGAVAILTFPTLGMQDQSARREFVDACQGSLEKSLVVLAYYMAGLNEIVTELFGQEEWRGFARANVWRQPILFLGLICQQ
jgi:hypothetical protein